MKAAGGKAADEVAPKALGGVAVVDAATLVFMRLSAVDLGRIDRSGLRGDVLPHPLGAIPIGLLALPAILRDVDERILLRVVEGGAMRLPPHIPLVPHFRGFNGLARLLRLLLDIVVPIGTPRWVAASLVVHAVEHVVVSEGMLEDLIDEGLLIGQHDLIVAQGGDGIEKGLPVAAGVGWIVRF